MITKITKTTAYYVETDEEEYNFYTRRGENAWSNRMGESDEEYYHCEELEKEFQEHIKVKEIEDDSEDFAIVSGQLFEEAVDFGKWLLKNVIYDSRKYYNLRENIGKFDKDDIYEVCELYTIWKETLK